MKDMRKATKDIIGTGVSSIIGLSMGGAVGNAAEGAATSTGMGAGASALARTTPTLYMAGFMKKTYGKKR